MRRRGKSRLFASLSLTSFLWASDPVQSFSAPCNRLFPSIVHPVSLLSLKGPRALCAPIRSLSEAFQESILDPVLKEVTADVVGSSKEDGVEETEEAWLQRGIERLKAVAGTTQVVEVLQEIAQESPTGALPDELFRALFSFDLDSFQLEALQALGTRRSVVVSAPTGSGKTVAGELAIWYALALGLKVMYTTPLKALSNQKFRDFRRQYGAHRVGLLTGDSGVNREAPVLVMTTEVFRNMLYDDLNMVQDVFAVVLDELHYMNDPSRGTVWEESIISAPKSLLIVGLSATVSNAKDIVGWFEHVHGPTKLVTTDFRPVPLRYLYGSNKGISPLFRDPDAGPGGRAQKLDSKKKLKRALELNPALLDEDSEQQFGGQGSSSWRGDVTVGGNSKLAYAARRGGNENRRPQQKVPSYPYVARCLARKDLLPAIVFIFSRLGCERAANDVANSLRSDYGLGLSRADTARITERLDAFDRRVGDQAEFTLSEERRLLFLKGLGVHHAGMLPLEKTLVEDLFSAGLLKICFATETLAAGINMPARTTVISTLSKRGDNGIGPLSVAQVLQMAGRAGRRGMDQEGAAVILKSRSDDAHSGRDLLLKPIEAIVSHFRPSYGMVAKLLRQYTLAEAEELTKRSFGTYVQELESASAEGSDGSRLAKLEIKMEDLRQSVAPYTLTEIKDYTKASERVEAAERILGYLIAQTAANEAKTFEALLPFARHGAALILRPSSQASAALGVTVHAALLGVRFSSDVDISAVTVLTAPPHCEVLEVQPEDIAHLDLEEGVGLPPADAREMFATMEALPRDKWVQQPSGRFRPALSEGVNLEVLRVGSKVVPSVEPEYLESGEIAKQRAKVKRQERRRARKREVLALSEHTDLEALMKDAEELDKIEVSVRRLQKRLAKQKKRREKQVEAGSQVWEDFLAMRDVLERFSAIDGDNKPTDLGLLVGSANSDNELWLALILTSPCVRRLSAPELASLISAVMIQYTRPDTFVAFGPSAAVTIAAESLRELAETLYDAQVEFDVDCPVQLAGSYAGLVESWASGLVTWNQLTSSTSMNQGDVCTMLRRTMEVLRSMTSIAALPNSVRDNARTAADAMNRAPLSDVTYLDRRQDSSAEDELAPIIIDSASA